METCEKGCCARHLKGFKSYYVVWKQSTCRCFARGCKLFKSYYVVWKRKSDIFVLRECSEV